MGQLKGYPQMDILPFVSDVYPLRQDCPEKCALDAGDAALVSGTCKVCQHSICFHCQDPRKPENQTRFKAKPQVVLGTPFARAFGVPLTHQIGFEASRAGLPRAWPLQLQLRPPLLPLRSHRFGRGQPLLKLGAPAF